ncbi:MAG: hypothetical protein J5819_07725, partial [Eubacterium sp.]|nr:hypothetical protein [Eubacterium sp.]
MPEYTLLFFVGNAELDQKTQPEQHEYPENTNCHGSPVHIPNGRDAVDAKVEHHGEKEAKIEAVERSAEFSAEAPFFLH